MDFVDYLPNLLAGWRVRLHMPGLQHRIIFNFAVSWLIFLGLCTFAQLVMAWCVFGGGDDFAKFLQALTTETHAIELCKGTALSGPTIT